LAQDKQRAGMCITVQSCVQIPIPKKERLRLCCTPSPHLSGVIIDSNTKLFKERDDRTSSMADENMEK